jgi:hypothetical protein
MSYWSQCWSLCNTSYSSVDNPHNFRHFDVVDLLKDGKWMQGRIYDVRNNQGRLENEQLVCLSDEKKIQPAGTHTLSYPHNRDGNMFVIGDSVMLITSREDDTEFPFKALPGYIRRVTEKYLYVEHSVSDNCYRVKNKRQCLLQHSDKHPATTLELLSQMRVFTPAESVTLTITTGAQDQKQSQVYVLPRSLLLKHSTYLVTLLQSTWKPDNDKSAVINIPVGQLVTLSALDDLVWYIFTGEKRIDVNNLLAIWHLADYLQITSLCNHLEKLCLMDLMSTDYQGWPAFFQQLFHVFNYSVAYPSHISEHLLTKLVKVMDRYIYHFKTPEWYKLLDWSFVYRWLAIDEPYVYRYGPSDLDWLLTWKTYHTELDWREFMMAVLSHLPWPEILPKDINGECYAPFFVHCDDLVFLSNYYMFHSAPLSIKKQIQQTDARFAGKKT